jgi:hypothetical protein
MNFLDYFFNYGTLPTVGFLMLYSTFTMLRYTFTNYQMLRTGDDMPRPLWFVLCGLLACILATIAVICFQTSYNFFVMMRR